MFAIAESEKLPSGAKAPLIPDGLSARLKSGPVTKPVWQEFFRSLFNRGPFDYHAKPNGLVHRF
jgi:hypothetical protein